jgi:hypothetical protein
MKSMIPEFNSNYEIKPYEGSSTPKVEVYETATLTEFVDGCYYTSKTITDSYPVKFCLAECVYQVKMCDCMFATEPEDMCCRYDYGAVGYYSEAEKIDLKIINPPVGIPLEITLSMDAASNSSNTGNETYYGKLVFQSEILLSETDIVRDTNYACSWHALIKNLAVTEYGELAADSTWSKDYIKNELPQAQQKGFYLCDLEITVKAKC